MAFKLGLAPTVPDLLPDLLLVMTNASFDLVRRLEESFKLLALPGCTMVAGDRATGERAGEIILLLFDLPIFIMIAGVTGLSGCGDWSGVC